MAAFLDKGRRRKLVEQVPLRLVLVDDIGQRGAKLAAAQHLKSFRAP